MKCIQVDAVKKSISIKVFYVERLKNTIVLIVYLND